MSLEPNYQNLELDELYHFIERKGTSETRENTYVIAMVSRLPRQIVGVDAAFDKSPERIQTLVDGAPEAENYCTDGFWGYVDVVYPGKHVRNIHNKNDTFTVESVNTNAKASWEYSVCQGEMSKFSKIFLSDKRIPAESPMDLLISAVILSGFSRLHTLGFARESIDNCPAKIIGYRGKTVILRAKRKRLCDYLQ